MATVPAGRNNTMNNGDYTGTEPKKPHPNYVKQQQERGNPDYIPAEETEPTEAEEAAVEEAEVTAPVEEEAPQAEETSPSEETLPTEDATLSDAQEATEGTEADGEQA